MRLASAWLARCDRGLTPAESAAFETWRHAHPHHAAAVAQLERTMATFDALRDLAPDFPAAPDPDAFAPPRSPLVKPRFIATFTAVGIAAALALLFWLSPARAPSAATWHFATTATNAAYQRATLIDGSTIELDADTTLDVAYSAAERIVRLTRGQAHFHVAKNPDRPFLVIAHGVTFRAVGTAFQVRLDPAAAQVEMLVTEGKVRVETPQSASATTSSSADPTSDLPLLTAGHRIVVSANRTTPPAITVVSSADLHQALAWQPPLVEFEKTPLSEIVAAFNRRNRQQLVLAEPALASLRLGGNFRLDQPDAFVRLLESSFGVAADRSEATIILRAL